MQALKTTIAGVVFSLYAVAALASSYGVVARDSNNNLVMDANNGCVRSERLHTNKDECLNRSIMNMDERVIHFAFDSSLLTAQAKRNLDIMADAFKKHNIKQVTIVGYTDKIGTDQYNDALSHRRANSVKKYLQSRVVLESVPVLVQGLGKTNAVKDCGDISARKDLINCLAPNRRVELHLDYKANS